MRKLTAVLLSGSVYFAALAVQPVDAGERGPALEVQATDPLDAIKQMLKKRSEETADLQHLSEMVLVPAGEFKMGFASGNEDEQPERAVFLDDFYMDKYEATQLQYLSVMGHNPSYFKNCPLCPVEKTTFNEAWAYCSRLNKRLPTEAEWEKAARGGQDAVYVSEGALPDDYAWYGNNSDQRTHPVGQKKPNSLGLYDMAGNVWEWVSDRYDPEYYKYGPAKNPRGSSRGDRVVVRGGAWGYTPDRLRIAYRESVDPNGRFLNGGFRCAADRPQK
ncbi:MAG: formylglycine-generating enzyme family protein [Nitrospinae bacterium]|nr:formylglycine-generating enzyme family protein [Nitrospinota bacterium]